MRKAKKIIVLFLVLSMLLSLTGCGKEKMYDTGRDGFTEITSIDGISFELVSSVARNATAITNVSEEMLFEPNQTYFYKNGSTEYFLFNISSIVCVAQKGTNFDILNAKDKKEAVLNGNICNIWFESPKKKLTYEEDKKDGVYKFIAEVTAGVTLTSNLYNDFAGKLAIITDGTTEWSMFIGSIGDDFKKLDKDTQEILHYMCSTLKFYDKPEIEPTPEPAVSMGGEGEATASPTATATPKTTASPEAEESTLPDATEKPSPCATPIPEEAESTPMPIEETPQPEMIDVEVIETSEDNVTSEPTPEETVEPTATPETEKPSYVKGSPIYLSNQKETEHDDETVYTVNIYEMLKPGKKARIDIMNGKNVDSAVVRLEEVLVGKEAVRTIKTAYDNGTAIGSYFNPPDGCSFHAARYTILENAGIGYVNVKLRGMDGENLKFRGIEYSQRTYDIKISDTEFISFYAVPNACPEYALEIGDGTVHNTLVSAYYRIQD